jgi:hypothetical protein
VTLEAQGGMSRRTARPYSPTARRTAPTGGRSTGSRPPPAPRPDPSRTTTSRPTGPTSRTTST